MAQVSGTPQGLLGVEVRTGVLVIVGTAVRVRVGTITVGVAVLKGVAVLVAVLSGVAVRVGPGVGVLVYSGQSQDTP